MQARQRAAIKIMRENLKVIEPNTRGVAYLGPYQEIAVYVRELLKCDYAFVAVPEKDAIRICAIAGPEREKTGRLVAELVAKLRDWGPVVVDDSRVIAAPMACGDHVLGVLVGYSSKPGTFTTK